MWGETLSGSMRNFYIHARICGRCYHRPLDLCATGLRIRDDGLYVQMPVAVRT